MTSLEHTQAQARGDRVGQRGYAHVCDYDIVAACGARSLQIIPIQDDCDWGVENTVEALGEEVNLEEVTARQFIGRM
jgi:hypothetical protein